MKLKSGFLSSEFYLALTNNVVGILVLLGYLTPAQANQLTQAVVSVVGGMMIIISTAIYLYSRFKLKSQNTVSSAPVSPLPMTSVLENLNPTGPTTKQFVQ